MQDQQQKSPPNLTPNPTKKNINNIPKSHLAQSGVDWGTVDWGQSHGQLIWRSNGEEICGSNSNGL